MENKFMILIIEDEKNIMDFLKAFLLSNDYQVRKAKTGKEGLSLMTSYNPDLILLDLGLPDIDGLDVLKQIRKWSEVPILVVSAREQAREKVEALDLVQMTILQNLLILLNYLLAFGQHYAIV